MKKIAVFFRNSEPLGHPFTTQDYWTSYTELSDIIKSHKDQLYFVRSQSSYLGNGAFTNSRKIENGTLVESGPITADVIFNKGRFKGDATVPIFNYPVLTELCIDKWKMYTQLKEFCPLTFLVENEEQLMSALSKLTTDRVVFKPVRGSEGIGVKIEPKNYFQTFPKALRFPAVVSDFLDTSVGVPGIVEGLHDLRVAVFDGEILYSYFRTPPADSFLANVSKGGRFEMVPVNKLPSEIIAEVMKIDSSLSTCKHRFYSVDFGYTAQGPKIIEMNSELGLLPNKDDAVFLTLKEKLAQALIDM